MAESIDSVTVKIPRRTLPRCPLCKRARWSRPIKVLKCGHSFCQECLKKKMTRRLSKHPQWWINPDFIRCPSCKTLTGTPWVNIKRLPTNFDLHHFLDVVEASKEQPLRTEAPCDSEDGVSDDSIHSTRSESSANYSVDVNVMTVWMGPYEEENAGGEIEAGVPRGPLPDRIFTDANLNETPSRSSDESVNR